MQIIKRKCPGCLLAAADSAANCSAVAFSYKQQHFLASATPADCSGNCGAIIV